MKERWDRAEKEKKSGILKTFEWWFFDQATGPQIGRLERMGILGRRKGFTKGQASEIIGLFEPAERKHLEILKKNNIALRGMNETKARETIARLLLDPAKVSVSDNSPELELENRIIKQFPHDFIYFVRFFQSSIRPNEIKPEYVAKDDYYRRRYEQAVQLGLCRKEAEIPLEEKLKTFRLKEMSALADGKKFTRKIPAIEHLMKLPDIEKRFEKMTPHNDWFQLKKMELNFEYLEEEWKNIHGFE